MECNYHRILDILYDNVWERINDHYEWQFFWYWLGDESNLSRIYKESFEQVIGQLTPEQIVIVEKKGVNLEKAIGKWGGKWNTDHPDLPNDTNMPILCLMQKIREYIVYQLNKPDIVAIIGREC
jgi:nitrogen fixation protein